MKYFFPALVLLSLISCSEEKKVNTALNSSNLESVIIQVNAKADTILQLPKGGVIKIDKGTFEKDVELEVKEAYSMNDIALAGLVTESNGQVLQSGGMLYINTKGKYPANPRKPIGISIPASKYLPEMKLFKGEEKDNVINWVESGNLNPAPDDCLTRGRFLFRRNCTSCHAMNKVVSGPALKGLTMRGPWTNRSNIYKYVHNPVAFMQTNAYARDLQRQFGQIMPSFVSLSDSELNCIVSFIENESKKALNDPSSFDLQRKARERWLGRDTVIYDWPDGSDTVVYRPDTTVFVPGPTDLRDTAQAIEDYYQFEIQTFGWYNVDALMKGQEGLVNCQVIVSALPSDSVHYFPYLLLPKRTTMVGGFESDKGLYSFEGFNGRPLPLYLNDPAVILMVGVAPNNRVYYGLKHFTTARKQTIPVKIVGPVTQEEFNRILKAEHLDDIKIQITR